MVATIARYHRKNIPRATHPEFMRLSEANRDRATRLAAILRIADALDRTHVQSVEGVEAKAGPEQVRLKLECNGDCLLERWALSQKKGLFEKVFARAVAAAS
jgi:exopolyphosphatase/guanosine-5'-triphosphate,3'-diphosphate pyrophosphatase